MPPLAARHDVGILDCALVKQEFAVIDEELDRLKMIAGKGFDPRGSKDIARFALRLRLLLDGGEVHDGQGE